MSARVLLGDCVEILAAFEPNSIDAVVCDPPYEIGFMGRAWDSAGVSYRVETWGAIERVLKPGGHLLAFGGTRTYHRMTVAIEDAGFEIRDSLHWIYGTGFPKARDVAELVDNELGVKRSVVREAEGWDTSVTRPGFSGAAHSSVAGARKVYEVTEATSPDAQRWVGWGTALKPAHEPIVLARKWLGGTIAANVLAYGTGGLNIDGARVGATGGVRHAELAGVGRWPANVALGHSSECGGVGPDSPAALCVPDCPVAIVNGDSPGAASFFYIAKPKTRERIGGTMRNLHVTVKPIDLMRYLVRLVTPAGGTVLDPFLGSGSTGCAAMAEGFEFVGIERDAESHETALARVSDYAFAYHRERPTSAA